MLLHLRNPKTILKKILIGLILFFCGAVTAFLISLILPKFLDVSWGAHPLVPIFIMTVISLVLINPSTASSNGPLRNIFFTVKALPNGTLMDLAEDLRTNLDLQQVSNLVVNTFGEVLHLKTVTLLVPDALQSGFETASAYGWPISSSKRLYLGNETPLVKLIHRTGPHVLVRGPL